jgi:O-antigen/teichoic acid export membrane protein
VNTLQRLLKNTVAMSATSALRLGVGLALTVYIARELGATFLGKYTLLVAYINIFQILSEAGIPRLATREVARAPQEGGRYFWNALATQLACSVLASFAMIAVVELLGYPDDTTWMLYLATGALPTYAALIAGQAILQAHERMEISTLAEIISSIGQLAATIIVLRLGYGVVGLALVKVLGFALIAVVNLLAVWRLRMVGRPQLDLRFCWKLLREASNILLMALFGAVLLRLDVLIIVQLCGEAVVGIYNAAYQLVKAFVLLVWAYADAIYPLLSRFYRENAGRMQTAIAASLQYGAIAILPLAVGVTMLASPVILLIYGNKSFVDAAGALRILVWHLLPFFAHTMLMRALIAHDRQDLAGRIEGLVVGAAAVYQLTLVYFFGMMGAAVAASLTFLTAVLISSRALLRAAGRLDVPWRQIGRAAAAAAGMGLVLWLIRGAGLWIAVPAGVLVYGILALALGAVSADDRRRLMQTISRRSGAHDRSSRG